MTVIVKWSLQWQLSKHGDMLQKKWRFSCTYPVSNRSVDEIFAVFCAAMTKAVSNLWKKKHKSIFKKKMKNIVSTVQFCPKCWPHHSSDIFVFHLYNWVCDPAAHLSVWDSGHRPFKYIYFRKVKGVSNNNTNMWASTRTKMSQNITKFTSQRW